MLHNLPWRSMWARAAAVVAALVVSLGAANASSCTQLGDTAKWAVIAFCDRWNGASSCEAEVLAASSPVFGARAAAELVARQAAALDRFFPGAARPGETPARRRVDFHVDPGTCIAARVDLSFTEPRTFAPSATSRAALFRVVTDAAGFVTAAQVLFSEAADEVAELSGYLETHGRLETAENGPFEAFVVLKISTKGNLGYLLSGGAKHLAAAIAKPDRGANALR